MELSYNWLKELVAFALSPEELAEKLTAAGLCIEGLEAAGDDWRLDAEVTTNRPDWLCHWGVAREIAAFTGLPVNFPAIKISEDQTTEITALTSVRNEAPDLCPRYTARVVTGVKVAASPAWLQERLMVVGLKPRNNIVDITNLVLFEMGQPLHAFDFDLLAGRRIIVRRAAEGEPFTSVFAEERKLDSSMCVIADAERPVALAGVKGGLGTAVHDGTVNILLESAYFSPPATRRTSRRAALESDSSYRFERGIDPGGVERASARACQLILELAGGKLARGIIDTNPELAFPREVSMRFARCRQLLGQEVPRREIEKIFTGLGLETKELTGEAITVMAPTFRQDLTREVDLIEEVVRCHGFGKVPTAITMPLAAAHESPATAAARKAIEVLVGLGYHECITDSFVPEAWADEIHTFESESRGALRVNNPVREDRPLLRTTLLPSLLEVRRLNREVKDAGFFEINRAYHPEHGDALRLAAITERGVRSLRGALEEIIRVLRIKGELAVVPLAKPERGFESGTVAQMQVDGRPVAVYGVLSGEVAGAHDLYGAPAALEVDFQTLVGLDRIRLAFTPLSKYPAVARDIALVVPEALPWAGIEAAVRELPELVESIEFASIYRGRQIPKGMKSVAFSILYRHPERSLTDAEANALRDRMVEHLTAKFEGASLR